MRSRSWLPVRVLLVVAAGATVVAAGVGLLLRNTAKIRDSAQASLRTEAYIRAVMDVERPVVDAETGLRGYVITGQRLFLQPLDHAWAALPRAAAALQDAARADRTDLGQARELVRSADDYLAGYARRVLATMAHSPPRARSIAVTLAGKREVDAIRAQTARLERVLEQQEDSREHAAQTSATRSIVEGVFALGFLTLLTLSVGGYLGRLALSRERERLLTKTKADELQQSILPSTLPAIPGCELAVSFTPLGGGSVGGDFYDVFETAPGRFVLILGDVAGKGPAAAAVSAMARWTLHSVSRAGVAPLDAVRSLNTLMLRDSAEQRFLTLAYLVLSLEVGHGRMTVACAGHPPPLLVPRLGPVEPVRATGDLIGVWPTIRLFSAEVTLGVGDSLVVFTDGVSDRGPGSNRSPIDALRERSPDPSAKELAGRVAALASEEAEQRDDAAVIALKYVGAGRSIATGSAPSPEAGSTASTAWSAVTSSTTKL